MKAKTDLLMEGRRGQFFSIITILMVLPIVAFSITFGGAMGGYGADVGEQVRLKSSYHFYHSVEDDLVRASQILGDRAILSSINQIVEEGEGLEDSSSAIRELITNGTLDGDQKPLMGEHGMDVWTDRIEDISLKRGYEVDIEKDITGVSTGSPWEVYVHTDYDLELVDSGGLFSLRKERAREMPIQLEGSEDPLIAAGTGGLVSMEIVACDFEHLTESLASGDGENSWTYGEIVVFENGSDIGDLDAAEDKILVLKDEVDHAPLEEFSGAVLEKEPEEHYEIPYLVVDEIESGVFENGTRAVLDGENDKITEIENLYRMWESSCYIPGNAPSFLQRLENDPDARSENGLNVFLRKGELEAGGVQTRDRSNLAHIYFSDEDVENCRVKGMPESFKIDKKSTGGLGIPETLTFDCE